MPDTRNITIEIISKTEAEEQKTTQPSVVNGSGDVNVDVKALLHPVKSLETKILGKSVLVNQAYSQAKRLVVQGVKASVQQYFSLSENYMAENYWNNALTTIGKASSLAGAITGGAIVGGLPGAIVGGTTWGVSELIQSRARMSEYYSNINATNYQTEFMQKRAGLYDGNRGTEN